MSSHVLCPKCEGKCRFNKRFKTYFCTVCNWHGWYDKQKGKKEK